MSPLLAGTGCVARTSHADDEPPQPIALRGFVALCRNAARSGYLGMLASIAAATSRAIETGT